MLYPQTNALRQCVDLSGYWDFRPDFNGEGQGGGWSGGFAGGRPIPVPASWNELFDDVRNYLGDSWYQTRFDLPWGWADKCVRLRFGSVNYLAEAWLNGQRLGAHEGGHLPFDFDVSDVVQPEGNLLVVRINGDLAPDRVPPGNVPRDPLDSFMNEDYPAASFDFFPYCGIQRPVLLYATAPGALTDLTVVTEIAGSDGQVRARLERAPGEAAVARVRLTGHGAAITGEVALNDLAGEVRLTVPGAALWSPLAPNLYDLTVELQRGGQAYDRYTLPIGIRTVKVEGTRLLLNGQPVRLTGFGRHEDFPLVGRGYLPATVIRDFEIMRWVGANSFRTSHYPYSEQMMQLADRLGFLVIDETPAVGLFFAQDGLERRNGVWAQQIRDLIARDKNHPSVIMWSLANEPHSARPEARAAFEPMFALARDLDPTRPLTFATAQKLQDQALDFCDVLCVNHYAGWYHAAGQLEAGFADLEVLLDALHEQFPDRPIILSEFGADTVAGHHAQPPEMFSEEYQAAMLEGYIAMTDRKPYVVGQHVWNLCDFKTSQSIRRVGALNLKGVFTRDRRPKLAAHKLRELWLKT